MKKIILTSIILISKLIFSQETTPITTSLPFLLISSDARSGGMGDIGVSTSSDTFSLYHNPAKITFNKYSSSIGLNYVPWLRNLTNDIFAGNLSFINRINTKTAWGIDFKYFSLGQIETTNNTGLPLGYKNPNELAVSGYYAMKLSEKFSMSVGLKFLNSNLDVNDELNAVNSFAVDLGAYYESKEENYGSFNGVYRFGASISNIGPKIEYIPGQQNFIPTNIKIAGGFDFIIDNDNNVAINLETRKLLVPKDKKENALSGMITSLGEFDELAIALGAEYIYDNSFGLRLGYFNQNSSFTGNKYITLGTGFKANTFSLDLSYLINTSNVNNPLENTLRFSLTFDFGERYE